MDEKTSRTLGVLLDDLDRTGKLTRDDVNRVVQRRGLDAHQATEIQRALAEQGLVLFEDQVADVDMIPLEDQGSGKDVSADSLRLFLRDAARVPLLFAEDEVQLGRRIIAGQLARQSLDEGRATREQVEAVLADAQRARERFAAANIRLVISIAKQARYNGKGLDFPDVVSEGILGLIRAVDKYDPSLGYKFSTYATWWIRQSIERALADKGRAIRLPVHVVEDINRIQKVQRALTAHLGREPSLRELAEDAHMDAGKVAFLLEVDRMSSQIPSLDLIVGEDTTLAAFVRDTSPPPEETILEDAFHADIRQRVEALLDERSRAILWRRYGEGTVSEDGCDTLDAIGADFGVTRERIRQLQGKAEARLREDIYLANLVGAGGNTP